MVTLQDMIAGGYITKFWNDSKTLYALNYTEKAVYEKMWNEFTLNARGHIYDLNDQPVAWAFPKFFNYSELNQDDKLRVLDSKKYTVTEKVDGSLGIVYYYDNEWRVNTRGSFKSDQAVRAKQMLSNYNIQHLDKNTTYLVEIIYPENRIIVDYAGAEKLVILSKYDMILGYEMEIGAFEVFDLPKTYTYTFEEIFSQLKTLKNDEGFVVTLEDNFRVKFKAENYLELARMKNNCSPLVIWENLDELGNLSEEFKVGMPEEFRNLVDDIYTKLWDKWKEIEDEVEKFYCEMLEKIRAGGDVVHEKNIGLFLKDSDFIYKQIIFPYHKQQFSTVGKLIKKLVRPKGNSFDFEV